jgi:hypothetical protein
MAAKEPTMIRTIEAVVDTQGKVELAEPIRLAAPRRALVTIFEDEAALPGHEAALLSETALEDWNRPEEDAAWSHLQSAR